MQVICDYQRRPSKGRLKIEKRVIDFVYLCFATQLVLMSVFMVKAVLRANRTFEYSIFVKRKFELVPALVYKTKTCQYSTQKDMNAFDAVPLTLRAENVNIIFADYAHRVRSLVIVTLLTVVFGLVNRIFIDVNFFSFKFRNIELKKDVISAVELFLLTYLLQEAILSQPQSALLRDYLRSCGVSSEKYLPWLSVGVLYGLVGVGYFTYLVTVVIYLKNTLPKYGTMTPGEIEEYKAWLRVRNAELEQARLFIKEARRAHARMQLLRDRTMPSEVSNLCLDPRLQPPATAKSMPLVTPESASLLDGGLRHAYYDIYSDRRLAQNFPPERMFGTQQDVLGHESLPYDSYAQHSIAHHEASAEFSQPTVNNSIRQRNVS